jgi:hypothetical protein
MTSDALYAMYSGTDTDDTHTARVAPPYCGGPARKQFLRFFVALCDSVLSIASVARGWRQIFPLAASARRFSSRLTPSISLGTLKLINRPTGHVVNCM